MVGAFPILRRSGLFRFCVVWIPTLDAAAAAVVVVAAAVAAAAVAAAAVVVAAAAVTRMECHQRLTERVKKEKSKTGQEGRREKRGLTVRL